MNDILSWVCVCLSLILLITLLNIFGNFRDPKYELIIKKLTYLYVMIKTFEETPRRKYLLKILKELVLDICGIGYYTTWLKWEAYWKKQIKEKGEKIDGGSFE